MATKLGNGGHSQESYDESTGRYIESNSSSSSENGEKKFYNNCIKGAVLSSDDIKNKVGRMNVSKTLDALRKASKARKEENYNAPFKKKDREWSLSEDIISVNPNHNTASKYNNNCQRCAPTFVARFCWGLDVEANDVFFSRNRAETVRENQINPWSLDSLYSVYDGANPVYHFGRSGKAYRNQSWQELDDFMSNMPDKAVVQVSVEGHTFCVLRRGGRNYCIEPQAPEYYKGKDFTSALDEADKHHRARYTIDSYCRVDNLKPSRRFWDVCHNREEK